MNSEKVSDMTRKLVGHEIKKNYLTMLKMLENIREDTNMSEDQFIQFRKIVLDSGNDTQRNAEKHLSRVKMLFNYGKITS